MKLLFCAECGDVFNLCLGKVKACSCGEVRGKYVDNVNAVVNGKGYSLAIGNGSLQYACMRVNCKPEVRRPEEREIICWSRQHEGPANPHTSIDENI